MKVSIAGPNLVDQSKGEFVAHKTGCADIAKAAKRDPMYRESWLITGEFESRRAVIEDIFQDFIFSNDCDPWHQFEAEVYFCPCCSSLEREVAEDPFAWDEVVSSNIQSMCWHDGEMLVQFKSGTIYGYIGVPQATYEAVLNAKSVGSEFAHLIKNESSFVCEQITL